LRIKSWYPDVSLGSVFKVTGLGLGLERASVDNRATLILQAISKKERRVIVNDAAKKNKKKNVFRYR